MLEIDSMIDIRTSVQEVIIREAETLQQIAQQIDESTVEAVNRLLDCSGRVIITGMGKAGLIARKAAATFCSTGTPASFLHPTEAIHGDLGLVGPNDLLLILSMSGETEEVLELLPYARRTGLPVISLTGNKGSRLAQSSDVVLHLEVTEEANPIAPAPTCSTTAMLAVCDGLAVALMKVRGFTLDQFAIFHPGGHLGRKLLLRVSDAMATGDDLPAIPPQTKLRDAIMEISRKALGCVFVVDSDRRLLGIFTDGDLRRVLQDHPEPLDVLIDDIMIKTPKQTHPESLAAEAMRLMETHSITVLPVVGENDECVGALHLHALVRLGLA